MSDEIGEARAEVCWDEVDLVKGDLAQESSATKHIGGERIKLVAGSAPDDDHAAHSLQEFSRLFALLNLD